MRHASVIAAIMLAASGGVAGAQERHDELLRHQREPGHRGRARRARGADAHCAALAEAAGVAGKTWAAYLSTTTVNARDRIGTGPWHNAAGVLIAENVEALHGEGNAISKETALDETGAVVNGRGDEPNRHDILTGSLPDGTAAAETCEDWTSSGEDTAGMVGHHDRMGLDDSDAAKSWNSSHTSRGGCGIEALRSTGGDGLLYCFAVE